MEPIEFVTRRRSRLSLAAGAPGVIAVLLCLPVCGQVNSVESVGIGYHAAGRGGTDAAVGDSALSQVRNPATLARHRRARVDSTTGVLFPHIEWENEIDGDTSLVKAIPVGGAGVALPVADDLTLGMALYGKSGISNRFKTRFTFFPDKTTNRGDFKNFALEANLGWRIDDAWSFGLGVRGEMMTLRTKVTLGPSLLDWDRSYSYGGGFQLGVHYQPSDDFAVGLAYRSESWMGEFDADAKLTVAGGGTTKGRLRNDGEGLPRALTLGLMWKPAPDWRLSADVRWVNYKGTWLDDFDTTGLVEAHFSVGFNDALIVGVGVEYAVDENWTAAAGYSFNTLPVGHSDLTPVSAIVVQNSVTVGLRYENEGYWFGISYGYGFSNTEHGDGSSNTGVDYDDIEMKQSAHNVTVGFGFTF